jgi:hypothetical protein
MLLDGLGVGLCLWIASTVRPAINDFSFIREVEVGTTLPFPLYFLLPILWIIIFSTLSNYDGRKFLRAADEVSALFLSTIISSV